MEPYGRWYDTCVPKRFLNPGTKPPGYTHVVTATTPARMVFISGQGGTDPQGKMPADFATQCENTFAHLTRCLALGGATWKDVVKINYYLTNIANLTELRAIRAKYLIMDAPPAATAVETKLSGGMLIEIECTAMVEG
ncbi:MAG: RidA family protein [Acidobacteria bacterium]|nr:RidA family protein [Acidobacteriota bacterium]